MTVAEYLEREQITAGELARRIGVGRVSVYQWADGVMPTGTGLEKLLAGTAGKVTVADLVRASEDAKARRAAAESGDAAPDAPADVEGAA